MAVAKKKAHKTQAPITSSQENFLELKSREDENKISLAGKYGKGCHSQSTNVMVNIDIRQDGSKRCSFYNRIYSIGTHGTTQVHYLS